MRAIRTVLVVAIVGTVKADAMGKKRTLRKLMCKRELEDESALVICVGKHCCRRDRSAALVAELREYAVATHSNVEVVTVGCLDVCKNGPIAATYPDIKFKKRVTVKRGRKLLRKLEHRRE